MPDTSIPVQPATATPGTPPAPLPLKMIAPNDGSQTLVQCVTIVDAEGRATQPMSEITGRRICNLLVQLIAATQQHNGGLIPSDDTAGIADPSS